VSRNPLEDVVVLLLGGGGARASCGNWFCLVPSEMPAEIAYFGQMGECVTDSNKKPVDARKGVPREGSSRNAAL
jgi:hypothetical protein